MPILKTGSYSLDYFDVGKGPVVVLIHSAASNNRQWRKIVEDHQSQYRFLAINLFGYGETTPWPSDARQTMADQVGLVEALCALVEEPLCIIGHSFGGAVAALAARALDEKVIGLVLLEANPFLLLASGKKHEAYDEIIDLRDFIQLHGTRGEWDKVAEYFVNYWLGEGAWVSLPADRKESFISALPNNFHEWNAIMTMDVGANVWQGIKATTLLVRARETPNSIKGIYEVLQKMCPHWEYQEVADGGHMAPVTRPDLVNPIIVEFVRKVFKV